MIKKNKYSLIFDIINNLFNYKNGFSRDDSVEILKENIEVFKIYSSLDLKKELNLMINDTSFDWTKFAIESELFHKTYSLNLNRKKIKDYIKYCLWDIANPDNSFSDNDRILMLIESEKIIKELKGWISLENLYCKIIQNKLLKELQFYNMYHLRNDSSFMSEVDARYDDLNEEKILVIKARVQ